MWITFWTAIGAIATVLAILIPLLRHHRKNKVRIKIFLSMQMAGLNEDKYKKLHQRLLHVIMELRKDYEVYFYNEPFKSLSEFSDEKICVESYLNDISASDCFIAILSEKVVSSIYFEIGYAIAHKKHIIVFVNNVRDPPLLIRQAAKIYPSVKLITRDDDSVIEQEIKLFMNVFKKKKDK